VRLEVACIEGVRLPPRIRPVLQSVATRLRPGWLRVQLVLADDALLHRLNRRYRHKNRPTDVLSFRYEQDAPRGAAREEIHAEIYVSVERARQQARQRGHGLSREIVLLVLHGLLHLQGHDHHTVGAARRMRAAERPHLRWLHAQWGGAPIEPLVQPSVAGEAS
jgi:probable rRNA maturation factor